MQNQRFLMEKMEKREKSLENHFGPFWPNFGPKHFFSKIRLGTFLHLLMANLMQKNQKKLMVGSMRTFVTDGLADGRTDGAGLIRTRIYKYPHQGRQNKWKK